jgi:hypothetical protein
MVNVKSIESGKGISWYYHDVFRSGRIKVLAKRSESGQLQFFAKESELYDLRKLKKLNRQIETEGKTFAFFFYEELKRLIGKNHGPTFQMSGLFSQKRSA